LTYRLRAVSLRKHRWAVDIFHNKPNRLARNIEAVSYINRYIPMNRVTIWIFARRPTQQAGFKVNPNPGWEVARNSLQGILQRVTLRIEGIHRIFVILSFIQGHEELNRCHFGIGTDNTLGNRP